MRTSVNLSLTIWDHLDDPYDHNELAANWTAIDEHDHSPGRGRRIPTAGLEDRAVTQPKIGVGAVTTVEILNKTILAEDLADGIIGLEHFSGDLLNKLVPLGMVVPWFRPNNVYPIPGGWVICDGQTVNDHGWKDVISGSVTVPDLRNRFILGATPNDGEAGTGPTTPPAASTAQSLVYGGLHTRTSNHSHTISAHSHTVDSHSHVVDSHIHVVNSHNHGIAADGAHSHGMHSRLNAFIQGLEFRDTSTNIRHNTLQSLYVAGFNHAQTDIAVPVSGSHAHTGATNVASPGTSAAAPGTSTSAPGTSSVALTTDGATSGGDIRPAYCGLLYIIKIKQPS